MMGKLGVSGCHCVDLLGVEDDQLSAVPKPCCALMLLFPLTQQVIMGVSVRTTSWKRDDVMVECVDETLEM